MTDSSDTHVYVWSVAKPMKHVAYKNAHAGGAHAAVWINHTTIATSGADGVVREVSTYVSSHRRLRGPRSLSVVCVAVASHCTDIGRNTRLHFEGPQGRSLSPDLRT